MIQRKISGQTIAIIILAMILLVSVAIGGSYAYFSDSQNLSVKEENAEFSPLNFEMERTNNQYVYTIAFYYKNNSDQEKEVSNLIIVLKNEKDLKRLKCDSFVALPKSNKYIEYKFSSTELYLNATLNIQNDFGVEKEINSDKLMLNNILHPVWLLMICAMVLFYCSYTKLKHGKRYLLVAIPTIIIIVLLIQIDKCFNDTWLIRFIASLLTFIVPVINRCINVK